MKKLLALAALLLFTGFAHATLIPNDMVPWSAPFTISDYDYYHNPVVFCQYTFPAGHTYSSNPSDYVETVDCINNPIPNDLSPPAQTQ